MIFIYRFILQLIWLLKPFLRFIPHDKIKFYFQHQGQIKTLNKTSDPLPGRPIWIHASSGEIEYAKSLIRELQKKQPHIPLLVTHTSLSSEKVVEKLGVSVWGVSPLDTPQDVKSFLAKWKPRACLIARTDLWPQTLLELSLAKIPCYLFSATFAQGSKKISFLSRQLLKNALPLIKKIYFVSQDDEKLCKSFFPTIKGEILGDTRYDQVVYRLQETSTIHLPVTEKILIAGSTWDEDERVLIPAFEKLKRKNWKFILVPHEIAASHMVTIRSQLEQTTLKCHFSSQGIGSFSWDQTDILLVDQVGILASLYSHARVAFVGGSFRKQVHSVMEALAANSPVILGPYHKNNREALEFKELGFIIEVRDTTEFVKAVEDLENRTAALAPLLKVEVQKRLGTTEKIMADLEAEGLFAKTAKT